MVSHKHKCIFVHLPKAAGTSIERAFMDDLGLDMDNRHALLLGKNTNTTNGPRRVSHLTASEYVDLHFVSQEIFDEYFKFAFVRNPIDRLYSTYNYRKFSDYLSFDNFIKLKLENLIASETEEYFYKPSYDYIYNDKGVQLVNFVGKLESLEDDFNYIQNTLDTNLELKHYNKSQKKRNGLDVLKIFGRILKDRQSWYNLDFKNKDKNLSKEALLIIKNYYRKDFENFNYAFPDTN